MEIEIKGKNAVQVTMTREESDQIVARMLHRGNKVNSSFVVEAARLDLPRPVPCSVNFVIKGSQ